MTLYNDVKKDDDEHPTSVRHSNTSKEAADSAEFTETSAARDVADLRKPNHDTPLLIDNDVISAPEPEMAQVKEDGIPYDRGWAWMIVLGIFVNYVLILGYIKSSGLFFVELSRKYNAPASQTALLFAVRSGVYGVSGFLVMNVLLNRIGARKLILLGGVLMALSAILSSLANQLSLLIWLQGSLLAVAHTLLISPGQVLLCHYFKRRRSLALSLSECGASVGNIVIPPLVSLLLSEYALEGTLLIYGGLCLNSLPAGLLHRPASFFSKRRHQGRDDVEAMTTQSATRDAAAALSEGGDGNVDGNAGGDAVAFCQSAAAVREGCSTSGCPAVNVTGGGGGRGGGGENSLGQFPSVDSSEDLKSNGPCKTYPRPTSERRPASAPAGSNYSSNDATQPEELRQRNPRPVDAGHPENVESGKTARRMGSFNDERSCRSMIIQCVLWCPKALVLTLDFSLFRKPLFLLFMLFTAVSAFVSIPVDYLPALVSQNDVSEGQAALLLSIIGGLDLVCRLSCGFLVNLNRVRASTLVLVSYVILAVLMQFVRFMTSFEHFLALAIIQGMLGSVGNCLFPVLVIDFVGLEHMASCIGFTQLVAGASMAGVYPFLGYIRDVTGSYIQVYHVIGGGMMVTAGLLCCEEPIRRLERRRQAARDQSSVLRQEYTCGNESDG